MEERRAAVRHKSFIQGRIYFKNRQASADCLIREFTQQGGRLEFSDPMVAPETFEVYIPSKNQYFQAKTIWHKGNNIGVSWLPEGALHPALEPLPSVDPIGDRVTKLEHEVALLRKRLDMLQG